LIIIKQNDAKVMHADDAVNHHCTTVSNGIYTRHANIDNINTIRYILQ